MEQLFEEARKESVRIMTRRLQERESVCIVLLRIGRIFRPYRGSATQVKQELTFRREAAQQEVRARPRPPHPAPSGHNLVPPTDRNPPPWHAGSVPPQVP